MHKPIYNNIHKIQLYLKNNCVKTNLIYVSWLKQPEVKFEAIQAQLI